MFFVILSLSPFAVAEVEIDSEVIEISPELRVEEVKVDFCDDEVLTVEKRSLILIKDGSGERLNQYQSLVCYPRVQSKDRLLQISCVDGRTCEVRYDQSGVSAKEYKTKIEFEKEKIQGKVRT